MDALLQRFDEDESRAEPDMSRLSNALHATGGLSPPGLGESQSDSVLFASSLASDLAPNQRAPPYGISWPLSPVASFGVTSSQLWRSALDLSNEPAARKGDDPRKVLGNPPRDADSHEWKLEDVNTPPSVLLRHLEHLACGAKNKRE